MAGRNPSIDAHSAQTRNTMKHCALCTGCTLRSFALSDSRGNIRNVRVSVSVPHAQALLWQDAEMTFHRFSPPLLSRQADRGDIAQSLTGSPMLICPFFFSHITHCYSHTFLLICLYGVENKHVLINMYTYTRHSVLLYKGIVTIGLLLSPSPCLQPLKSLVIYETISHFRQ